MLDINFDKNWKDFDCEQIKLTYEAMTQTKDATGRYLKRITPYPFLVKIKMDLYDYDVWVLKYKQNAINDKLLEKKVEIIYWCVQHCISELEQLSLANPKLSVVVEKLKIRFQPGYAKEEKTKKYFEDVERGKQIQKLINNSPLKI